MPTGPARRTTSLLGAIGVFTLALLTACASDPQAAQTAPPTPIARLQTKGLELPRLEFCGLVPSRAVRSALGDSPSEQTRWGNGESPSEQGVPSDALHELGCAWRASSGWVARAWVFAPPVTGRLARRVVASAGNERGCRTVPGPRFGDPSYAQVCDDGDRRRARNAGLFGQAWLTCEVESVAASPEQVRERADRWCVELVNALSAAD